MSELVITPMAPHEFGVQVREGVEEGHRVTVPESLLEAVGAGVDDEERVVRESFGFLLEREPATSIERAFSLDRIGEFFPEYVDELRLRLG